MKPIIIIIIASGALLACTEKKASPAPKPVSYCLDDSTIGLIAIDTARYGDLVEEIQLSGEVSFNENKVGKVYARSSGQVIESKVTLGDRVTQGQVLAVIRSADVAGSYADLSSADADLAVAKREVDNTESLYNSGIASERELTEARQNYEKALAVKRKINAALHINSGGKSDNNGLYYLTAPVSGYVVEKKINTGNFIRPDMDESLFTISNMQDVWVWGNVFEADIPKINEGDKATVSTLAYPGKIFTGLIDKVSEVLDPENKAMRVRIRLQNPELLLKPAMFTKVIIQKKATDKKEICVSKKALIDQNGKTFVVVYNSNCDMRITEVEVQKPVADKVYVLRGLKDGDKVITQNELLVFQELLNY
ncbi:efflux RND transporter periplasmic adaptor subunit [Foetidibacter luteolus]|uniref:efflux RND transporter periplasmic adaptor subunit n=1 Tax=Foetidibacter luteolus TaxID=2608880 RepID=UPI00129A217A|nr:efflux RND transporter periplasmic adaptor subunit [Foetidibacter luteolus]